MGRKTGGVARRLYLRAVSRMAIALAIGTMGAAQVEAHAASQQEPGRSAEAKSDHDALEEIVVTAQRREQRLQDVPISISAISAEDIDRRGLVGGADYLRGMPSVNQIEAVPSQSVVIRGIETQHAFQGLTGGQATGAYFGETPINGSAGFLSTSIDLKLVDIDRVEVLKGPQGTTFGSGALGGVVRIIPVAPQLDSFEGKVSFAYSRTEDSGGDNYDLQGIVNIPLVADRLAIRASAYHYDDSGFYRNRVASNTAFQTNVVVPQGAQAFATDGDEVGRYRVTGARTAALFRATDDLKFTLSYLTQETKTDGIPVAMTAPYEQTVLRVAPEHVRRGQGLGLLDTNVDLVNALVEYDLGWADVLASYSYVSGGTTYMRPMTSVGLMQSRSQGNESTHRGHVGELRLASKLDGPLNFLAGVYAEDGKDRYDFDMYWFGSLASSPYTPRGFGRYLGDSRTGADQTQYAAFGEISWELLPNLTLTGGGRIAKYDVSVELNGTGINPTAPKRSVNDTQETFKVNLSYKPNDDTLLYAGWSQGFRLGRPTTDAPDLVRCDVDNNGIYDGTDIKVGSLGSLDSDTVDSYEAGAKLALLNGRVRIDAAAFRNDWTGIPVLAVLPCQLSYSVNAGTARSEGVEVQLNFKLSNALRLDLGGSWINARLTKDVPAQGWAAGDKLPGSPSVTANAALQYEFRIGDREAYVRADTIYVGPFKSLIGQLHEAGDYTKLDVAARIDLGQVNVDLFVKNLTNEDAYSYHSPFALPGIDEYFGYQLRPRTFGLQIGYGF